MCLRIFTKRMKFCLCIWYWRTQYLQRFSELVFWFYNWQCYDSPWQYELPNSSPLLTTNSGSSPRTVKNASQEASTSLLTPCNRQNHCPGGPGGKAKTWRCSPKSRVGTEHHIFWFQRLCLGNLSFTLYEMLVVDYWASRKLVVPGSWYCHFFGPSPGLIFVHVCPSSIRKGKPIDGSGVISLLIGCNKELAANSWSRNWRAELPGRKRFAGRMRTWEIKTDGNRVAGSRETGKRAS